MEFIGLIIMYLYISAITVVFLHVIMFEPQFLFKNLKDSANAPTLLFAMGSVIFLFIAALVVSTGFLRLSSRLIPVNAKTSLKESFYTDISLFTGTINIYLILNIACLLLGQTLMIIGLLIYFAIVCLITIGYDFSSKREGFSQKTFTQLNLYKSVTSESIKSIHVELDKS